MYVTLYRLLTKNDTKCWPYFWATTRFRFEDAWVRLASRGDHTAVGFGGDRRAADHGALSEALCDTLSEAHDQVSIDDTAHVLSHDLSHDLSHFYVVDGISHIQPYIL